MSSSITPSLILNYSFIIITIITFITLIRILTMDTSRLPELSTLTTWISVLHYSCMIITVIILSKILMIGMSQEIIPYIITYILFIIGYIYGLFKVASYIAW